MVQSSKKTSTVSFRLSEEQSDFIDRQAAAAGINRSEYILRCALQPSSIEPPSSPTIPQALLEIQEIAKNTLLEFRQVRNLLELRPCDSQAILDRLQRLLAAQSDRVSSL